MAQQIIDVGANANDGTGDSLYEAGQKINANFEELFEILRLAEQVFLNQFLLVYCL